MHLHFRSVQEEQGINFAELYKQFSEDEVFEIRYIAASSLHEAFRLVE